MRCDIHQDLVEIAARRGITGTAVIHLSRDTALRVVTCYGSISPAIQHPVDVDRIEPTR